MATKILSVPEDAVVNMLKTLPKKELIDIFWKIIAESDVSPLTDEERKDVRQARKEFKKGETIKWESIR